MTRKFVKEKQKDISDQTKTNPKRFWKYVNQKRKYEVPILSLYKCKTKNKIDLVETDIDKAETANQFISVFTKNQTKNGTYFILLCQMIAYQFCLVKAVS